MPSACRRLMCVAAEDVGLAYPQILPIVNACVDMALKLGMPEAGFPGGCRRADGHQSQKSNSAYLAIDAALDDVCKGKSGDFPGICRTSTRIPTPWSGNRVSLPPHNYPKPLGETAVPAGRTGGRALLRVRPQQAGAGGKTILGQHQKGVRHGHSRERHSRHEKSPTPCGEKRWLVLRTGADFRLRCLGCGHELMTPRFKAEKISAPWSGRRPPTANVGGFFVPRRRCRRKDGGVGKPAADGGHGCDRLFPGRGVYFAIPAGGDALKIYLDLVVILNFLVDFCCFWGQTVYRAFRRRPSGRRQRRRWGRSTAGVHDAPDAVPQGTAVADRQSCRDGGHRLRLGQKRMEAQRRVRASQYGAGRRVAEHRP